MIHAFAGKVIFLNWAKKNWVQTNELSCLYYFIHITAYLDTVYLTKIENLFLKYYR